jgi:hypothetical protein
MRETALRVLLMPYLSQISQSREKSGPIHIHILKTKTLQRPAWPNKGQAPFRQAQGYPTSFSLSGLMYIITKSPFL